MPASQMPASQRKPVLAGTADIVEWRLEHFVDGKFVSGTGDLLAVENPATEAVIASFRQISADQIGNAVAAARRAFESGIWRDAGLRRRSLLRLADLLVARGDEFKSALVSETGTPVSIGRFLQFDGPVDMLRYIATRAGVDRTRKLGVDPRPPASESLIRYEPVGVAAGIGAYNNPLLYLASKAGAALAAGCACVFMPSSLAPLTALLFGELIQEAGIPDGVLNIIAGGPEAARALTSHPGIDKISLTGSVAVGRQVMHQAADGPRGVVLELGGKSAGIVLPGADLTKAVLPLHGRYLRNAGQGCQSPTRLLIPATMFDDFIDLSRDAYARIPVGDPRDPATMIGPLISEPHRARVEGHVERALADGGKILVGGGRPDMDRGWFMNGALLGGLSNGAEIARNELFGPVAIAMPYRDVDEAVAIANDSDLGLAASVFGPLDLASDVAARLRVGSVYINGGGNFRVDSVLSGWKHSGIGKEWGEDGVAEYLQAQHIQWTI